MLELISIHIPKTAGTSFYHILSQVYGEQLSKSFRRRDILPHLRSSSFECKEIEQLRVLHGHFYYSEIAALQEQTQAKVICWLRDPVERVVSNYRFFIAGLSNPQRNPADYAINQHRSKESLLEYAQREENRNRMSKFLAGLEPEKLFFCGQVSHFAAEVERLGQLLDWPPVDIPKLNVNPSKGNSVNISADALQLVRNLNSKDIRLYHLLTQS